MASPFCSRCAIYRANRILHDLADKTSGKKLRGQGPVQLVAVFRTEGAPFEAPLKDRGKHGKQNFFAFWFHRGRGGELWCELRKQAQERFLPARPGAHRPCGRKGRVAPLGMTLWERQALQDPERSLCSLAGLKPGRYSRRPFKATFTQ